MVDEWASLHVGAPKISKDVLILFSCRISLFEIEFFQATLGDQMEIKS